MDTQTLLLILAPLVIVQLALQVSALVDVWKHKGAKGNTTVWVVVIVFFQMLGPITYYFMGRKESYA